MDSDALRIRARDDTRCGERNDDWGIMLMVAVDSGGCWEDGKFVPTADDHMMYRGPARLVDQAGIERAVHVYLSCTTWRVGGLDYKWAGQVLVGELPGPLPAGMTLRLPNGRVAEVYVNADLLPGTLMITPGLSGQPPFEVDG